MNAFALAWKLCSSAEIHLNKGEKDMMSTIIIQIYVHFSPFGNCNVGLD